MNTITCGSLASKDYRFVTEDKLMFLFERAGNYNVTMIAAVLLGVVTHQSVHLCFLIYFKPNFQMTIRSL